MTRTVSLRRVVVTGIGLVTPVGLNTEETWNALLEGRNGIDRITGIDTTGFSIHIAGEVKGLNPVDYMDAKDAKRYDRFVHFAMAAARMALSDSKLDLDSCDRNRCACIIGSGVGGILSAEDQMQRFMEKGPSRISPLTIPKIMVNCASGLIAIDMGLKGINYATVSACASGAHAIGLALRHLQWGEADVALTGGAEAGVTILGLGGFANMMALSARNDDPSHASRPFDKERDGFVIGEGAGILVLETLENAVRRGARVYAELLGYGFTDDAYHITAPEPSGDGSARAMRLALEDAGRPPEEVDYINAHGTSTLYNDRTETMAIKIALGEATARRVKINSTKSMIGHLLGAAAGVECCVTALSIYHQKIHGTSNYTTPDPDCDLDYSPNRSQDHRIRLALSNSLGFGGHNAILCLGRHVAP
ncbi:MAG: beta-ketoacyl-ACP synthase II [Planctomycetota bacterium]